MAVVPRTLPDARWSCRSCGACCRGFSFGPVEPEIVAGLEARDIAAHWPPAAEAPWVVARPGPDGAPVLFLTHRDDHCVFLDTDDSCAVHRLFGAEAKPWFCREYPFQAVEDGAGVSVAVRADCGGLHESFEDGEPVALQAAEALALPRIVPRPRYAPAQVVILPGLAISPENWADLLPVVLAELEPPRSPEDAVAAVRAMLYRLAGRPAPASDPARSTALVAELAARIAGALGPAVRDPRVAAADRLLRVPIRPLPEVDERARQYLGVVLRSELLTHRHGSLGGVPEGLGLYLLEVAVARLNAAGAGPLSPRQVGTPLSTWKRAVTLPPVWAAVRAVRPLLVELAMAAG